MTGNSRQIVWKLVWGGCLLLLMLSFWRNFQLHLNNQDAVKTLQEQVQNLEAQNAELEEKVQTATSSFRLEERARQELHYQKPGETLFVPKR